MIALTDIHPDVLIAVHRVAWIVRWRSGELVLPGLVAMAPDQAVALRLQLAAGSL